MIGAAIDCYETALAYAKSREQFGRPSAGFQLVQEKLVWMVQEITKAQLLAGAGKSNDYLLGFTTLEDWSRTRISPDREGARSFA